MLLSAVFFLLGVISKASALAPLEIIVNESEEKVRFGDYILFRRRCEDFRVFTSGFQMIS